MTIQDRKAAVEAYRERKVRAGIYAVRCGPSGQAWVGRAPDLSTIQNRIWFALRHGGSPHRTLQAAWREQGPDAFAFEILEELEPEESRYLRDRALKERAGYWSEKLQATAI